MRNARTWLRALASIAIPMIVAACSEVPLAAPTQESRSEHDRIVDRAKRNDWTICTYTSEGDGAYNVVGCYTTPTPPTTAWCEGKTNFCSSGWQCPAYDPACSQINSGELPTEAECTFRCDETIIYPTLNYDANELPSWFPPPPPDDEEEHESMCKDSNRACYATLYSLSGDTPVKNKIRDYLEGLPSTGTCGLGKALGNILYADTSGIRLFPDPEQLAPNTYSFADSHYGGRYGVSYIHIARREVGGANSTLDQMLSKFRHELGHIVSQWQGNGRSEPLATTWSSACPP